MEKLLKSFSFWVFIITMVVSYFAGRMVQPTLVLEKVALDAKVDMKENPGNLYYVYKGKKKYFDPIPIEQSRFINKTLQAKDFSENKDKNKEFIVEVKGENNLYYLVEIKRHFGWWSLIPALVAVVFCWVLKEPVASLAAGIFSGALLLQKYDIPDAVFLETFMSKSAAGVLLLYLWLLGGLMGMWSKTGAAKAFAQFMTEKFVRGPRSAKFVAWALGIIFFQGGTVSTVLVGTTVKPLADKEKISHEELSYIVDSTASPIASILAFNAWPGYVQAFLFVPGVAWLTTEADRIAFFFKSIPLSFYSIFAVLGTLLLSFDKSPWLPKNMKEAIRRSREEGKLDSDTAEPLSARELEKSDVPENYNPHIIDFFSPLLTLIFIAIGTFIAYGSPNVRIAFGVAMMLAFFQSIVRGMKLRDAMEGINNGIKGVVLGSVILVLAITIGNLSKEAGGGMFLIEILGTALPFWILPIILLLLTIIIAFSTGTSWGTYAVTFPLAMPLSWAIANANGMAHPEFYMMICFAAVMNGSVYGDQCSPISDTTVLSAMCTGCDLMDHVKTQLPAASVAAALAAILWTLCTFFAL
jgi:Na+/H+ antiporter NhaC